MTGLQPIRRGNCEGVRGDGHSCTSGTIPGRRARWITEAGRLLCGTCAQERNKSSAFDAVLDVMTETQEAPAMTEPFVGQPATINLFSDSLAAVVTKVNKKSIVVQRVETTERHQDMSRDGADYLPVMVAEGVLDRIVGSPERYSRVETSDGPRFRNGSISVTLGRSVSVTDYRY